VFCGSEQFHLDPGNERTSLISSFPGIAGAGRGEPGTDGGIRGAHPCILTDEAYEMSVEN
jgi:hypothetical protein